jgi:hypothetical protein
MSFHRLLFFFTATIVFVPGSLPASIIFTTGPDAGLNLGGYMIESGYAVTEAFTLTSSATLNQVTFDDWSTPGTAPQSIDWEITSQPDAGVLFSGTAAAISSTYLGVIGHNGPFTDWINNSSFQTGAITLRPGTYWLLLDNCSPARACGWGQSSSIGAAQQYLNGVLYQSDFGTQSFTLSGSVVAAPAAAPEPAGMLPVGGLFLAVAIALRRRQLGFSLRVQKSAGAGQTSPSPPQ